MMTEKRFKLKENLEDVLIEDTITQSQYSIYGIVDLLNEQQSTITKLKELNGDKGKRIISLIRTNKTLKEENEQLKKARDKSDKFIVKKGLEIEFLEWCMK